MLLLFSEFFKSVAQLLQIYMANTILHQLLDSSFVSKISSNILIIGSFFLLNAGKFAKLVLFLLDDFAHDSANYVTLATAPDTMISFWVKAYPYWTVFMFFWDIIPMDCAMLIVANRKKNLPFFDIVRAIWVMDKWIFGLNGLQFLSVGIYYSLQFARYYTNLLLNDRSWYAMNGVYQLIIALHSILLYLTTIRVKVNLLKGLAGAAKEKAELKRSKSSSKMLVRVNTLKRVVMGYLSPMPKKHGFGSTKVALRAPGVVQMDHFWDDQGKDTILKNHEVSDLPTIRFDKGGLSEKRDLLSRSKE